jgi:class 3 adenylate cyclase
VFGDRALDRHPAVTTLASGVHQPLANRAWSVAMVGRTGARASLRRWITDTCEGELRVVAVSGPTGIGKSRALEWAADEMRRQRGIVGIGRCSPAVPRPYGPLAHALGALGPGPPEIGRRGATAPFDAASSFEQTESANVQAMTATVIAAATSQPVLLAVEDLHWSDHDTRASLEQLVYMLATTAAGCRVLVVVTHRPLEPTHPAAETIARLARERAYRGLPLEPLDELELQDLIRRLTATTPDRRLVRHVHDMSGGNPLVAIAMTDDAVSGAAPTRAASADDVLTSGLAALSPAASRVALALALIGGRADANALAAACEATAAAVLDAADELERARLVHATGDRWELAYPNIADALLRSSTSRERRGMHGRIAALLDAPATSVGLVELAHHLEEAGPGHEDRLAAVAPGAAEQAFAAGAWAQAGHLYEIALDVAGDAPRPRAELEERAGLAYFRDFDATRCLDHLARAAELAAAAGDPALAARADIWHLRRRFTAGSASLAHPVDVTAVARIAEGDLPVGLRARAHGLLAEVAFQANDRTRALRHAAAARALAEQAGEPSLAFWVSVSEGLAHIGVLDLRAAGGALARAEAAAQDPGLAFVASAGTTRRAATELLAGDLVAAEAAGLAAGRRAAAAGNWAEHALAHTVAAIAAGTQGRLDDLEDLGEVARISCGRATSTFTPLLLYPAIAWGRALRGDAGGASSALDELDAAGGRSARYRLAVALLAGDEVRVDGLLADHEWRDLPQALGAFDAGAHAAELELAIHAGDTARVRAARDPFEPLDARGVAFTLEWPCLVPRLRAEAAASLGEVDAALSLADRAARIASDRGARVEQARLAVLRARLLLARRDDASVRAAVGLIDDASTAFDAMGMLRHARHAERLVDLPPPVAAAARSLRPRSILFTDIVDSTAWNARLGDDGWIVVLADHNRRSRAAVRRHHGVVVKTTGDGVCAWFGAAAEAVDCAQALQRDFEEFRSSHPDTAIRIRCGVALGDVVDFDGDIAGIAVTEAARICAVAGGDQIAVSATVAHGDEGGGRRYRSLGDFDLKGLPGPNELFAVRSP